MTEMLLGMTVCLGMAGGALIIVLLEVRRINNQCVLPERPAPTCPAPTRPAPPMPECKPPRQPSFVEMMDDILKDCLAFVEAINRKYESNEMKIETTKDKVILTHTDVQQILRDYVQQKTGRIVVGSIRIQPSSSREEHSAWCELAEKEST